MILTEAFIDEIRIFEKISEEVYEKVINFAISYIAKHDTQTTLSGTNQNFFFFPYIQEVLEIDEKIAENLFNLSVKLVSFFAKFRFGDREFRQNIEFLTLSPVRKQIFLQKLEASWKDIHKKLGFVESDGTPFFKKLDWRYDLQICSRTNEDELIPRVFLNFQLENEGGEKQNILIESDYANIKNLHDELNYLVRLHDSARQQKIKKLGQLL